MANLLMPLYPPASIQTFEAAPDVPRPTNKEEAATHVRSIYIYGRVLYPHAANLHIYITRVAGVDNDQAPLYRATLLVQEEPEDPGRSTMATGTCQPTADGAFAALHEAAHTVVWRYGVGALPIEFLECELMS